MANTTLEPTLYNLQGDHTSIVYSTTSVTGHPKLEYKTGHTHLTFDGPDIRSIATEFAKLITLTIETVADAGNTTVTLLIPTITLTAAESKATFDTRAVLTAVRRLGPVHQHYTILNLHGTAQFVVF